ncbi:hypothetical protein DM02DRAFT_687408, partial [Periconia macrospinosa]
LLHTFQSFYRKIHKQPPLLTTLQAHLTCAPPTHLSPLKHIIRNFKTHHQHEPRHEEHDERRHEVPSACICQRFRASPQQPAGMHRHGHPPPSPQWPHPGLPRPAVRVQSAATRRRPRRTPAQIHHRGPHHQALAYLFLPLQWRPRAVPAQTKPASSRSPREGVDSGLPNEGARGAQEESGGQKGRAGGEEDQARSGACKGSSGEVGKENGPKEGLNELFAVEEDFEE